MIFMLVTILVIFHQNHCTYLREHCTQIFMIFQCFLWCELHLFLKKYFQTFWFTFSKTCWHEQIFNQKYFSKIILTLIGARGFKFIKNYFFKKKSKNIFSKNIFSGFWGKITAKINFQSVRWDFPARWMLFLSLELPKWRFCWPKWRIFA